MEPLDILIALNTPDGKADPYPLYNALHEMGEVVEIGDNDVFVVGYDAINSVLRDPGFLVSSTDTFDAGLPQWRQNPVFVQAADWILNLATRPSSSPAGSATTPSFIRRRSPRTARWSRCSAPGTGIRAGSPTPANSTRCAPTAGRLASAAGRTSASAPRWPGLRRQSRSRACSAGSRRSPLPVSRPGARRWSCAASTSCQ